MLYAPPLSPTDTADHAIWSRDDLLLVQRKVIRDWSDSDWLANTAPRTYEAVRTQDASMVRVDLGGGMGEGRQQPGMIVLGTQSRGVRMPAGQSRTPDLYWPNPPRLPFADDSIDELWVPDDVEVRADEIGRVLRLAGRVRTTGPTPATVGPAGGVWHVCTHRSDRIERVSPNAIEERVLGQRTYREKELSR